jgi:GT2 family glycosyltransferase
MKPRANITTIIINWNLKGMTARCLDSLAESSVSARTIIVDNGSEDGSVQYLRTRYPHTTVIALAYNHGFGSACNIAIQHALQDPECEYIFLLNNDAIVERQALEQLLEAGEAQPQAGIFGPKIYNLPNSDTIWYGGAHRRRGVLAAKVAGRGEVDRGQFDQVDEVDYIFGAGMFIRREVIDRIGLFDERYFIYLEDLDLCMRAQQAGFQLRFVPQAQLWHIGSASTAEKMAMRRYHHVRSTILFLRKHITRVWMLPAALFWTSVFLKLLCRDLLKSDGDLITSYFTPLISIIKDRGPATRQEAKPGGIATATPPASNTHQG